MARLLIVEEALKNRSGHWYEYNRAIVQEARGRGHDVSLLAHQAIDPEIQQELSAEPFFPITSWDQVYNYPSAWKRYFGILRHNFSIASLLQRHFKSLEKPYDVVLVPTVVLYHWLAWRWLVFRGANRWFKRVVLTTRNNAGEYDAKKQQYVFNSSAKVLSAILKSFQKPVSLGFVEMASDSSRLAEQYQGLSGLPFRTYPHPRPTDHLLLPKAKTKSQLVFSALGPPRYEKGSDLIIEAINCILQDNPNFPGRFVIQWNTQVYSPEGVETILPEDWEANTKVEIIRNSLSSDEYQRRMDETDVVLVPYRRSQYRARLSGIVIEAFQSGIPCICISDTWLADCMKEIGKGVSIKKESVSSLQNAIKGMVSEVSSFQFTENDIIRARIAHSPKSFVDLLFLSSSNNTK